MILAPKGHGWTAILHDQYPLIMALMKTEENAEEQLKRDRYWQRLRKTIQKG